MLSPGPIYYGGVIKVGFNVGKRLTNRNVSRLRVELLGNAILGVMPRRAARVDVWAQKYQIGVRDYQLMYFRRKMRARAAWILYTSDSRHTPEIESDVLRYCYVCGDSAVHGGGGLAVFGLYWDCRYWTYWAVLGARVLGPSRLKLYNFSAQAFEP